MIKRKKIVQILCLVLVMVLFSRAARTQLAAGMSLDAVGDSGGAVTTAYKTIVSTVKEYQTKLQEALTAVKGLPGQLKGGNLTFLSKVPGTKKAPESLSVKFNDPEAVEQVFYELFLQYPSNSAEVKSGYENKGVELYYDTMVELKTATDSLLAKLDEQRKRIDNLKDLQAISDSQANEENGEDSEQDSGAEKMQYYNAYRAQFEFNRLLRIVEEVVAMRNLYEAVRILQQPRLIAPAEAPEEEEEDTTKSSFIFGRETMAFAQQLYQAPVASSQSLDKSADLTSDIKQPSAKTLSAAPSASKGFALGNKAEPATLQKVSNQAQFAADTLSRNKTDGLALQKMNSADNALIKDTEHDSKPKAKRANRSTVKFAVPAAPEADSPFNGAESELRAISKLSDILLTTNEAIEVHNIIQRMPEYKDMYVKYEKFKQLHEVAVDAVKTADQCVIQYIGRRYKDPNNVWFGQSTPPENTNDYDGRKGLSGWTIATFEVANASIGNEIDIDSFAEQDIDASKVSDTLQVSDINKIADPKEVSSSFASPSKEQEFSDATREVGLLNWQIGRKAAQLLADDQRSENPKFGKPEHEFPLWNDQRSYYDQYIEGKYENMKAYLNKLDVSQSAIGLLSLISNEQSEDEGNAISDGINKIRNYLKGGLGASPKSLSLGAGLKNTEQLSELKASSSAISQGMNPISDDIGNISLSNSQGMSSTLLLSKTASIQSLKKRQKQELLAYERKLESLNAQLDNVSDNINELTSKINSVDEQARKNENEVKTAQSEIEMMDKRGTSVHSSTYVMSQKTFTDSGAAYAENIDQLAELRTENKKLKNNRDKIYDQINIVNSQIAAINQKYQERLVDLEMDFDSRIETLQQSSPIATTLGNIANTLNLSGGEISSLLSKVDSLVGIARQCASSAIQKHLSELQAMSKNDTLYINANNKLVVEKHAALIEKLKKLPEDCFTAHVRLITKGTTLGVSAVVSRLSEIFSDNITTEICAKHDCTAPDSQYFVGLPAKARDFTAPHAPLTSYYPPIRDMVHLDTIDYRNIEKGDDGKISRTAFLDYGPSQPYIWELLLSDKAYVEKGVNLSKVLNKGGEAKAFMRGYMLPCRKGKYIVDISKNAKYQIIDTQQHNSEENIERHKQLQQCVDIKVKNFVAFVMVNDTDVKDTVTASFEEELEEDPTTSELGMFLKYTNGTLRINDRPYDGFSTIVRKEDKAEKDGELELSATDNAYERAMFAKNQIGDFLHFVDKERQIKKNLDRLEISIGEVKENLKEVFAKIGFELKEDLNLANSSDYDYVINQLKTRKNVLTGEISEDLGGISYGNPTVKERFDKVNNLYLSLIQDSQALTSLSANSEAGSVLESAIKTARANEKVVEKTRKDGYSAIQKEIEEYEQPVCMPY